MNLKPIITSFIAIFLAELGDKTQIAVITLSAETRKPVLVAIGAIVAFAIVTIIGSAIGSFITKFVPGEIIEKIAGAAFIIIGILMLFEKI